MIFANLHQAPRYVGLHPLFPKVFEYIQKNDLFAMEAGRYPIAGDDLIVIIERTQGRKRELAPLECHRKYIDIQFVLDGEDEMGWAALSDCTQPRSEFNEEKDIQFFDDAVSAWVKTPANHLCIFFPEDAHAPLVSDTIIHKAIFKVALSI